MRKGAVFSISRPTHTRLIVLFSFVRSFRNAIFVSFLFLFGVRVARHVSPFGLMATRNVIDPMASIRWRLLRAIIIVCVCVCVTVHGSRWIGKNAQPMAAIRPTSLFLALEI